MWSFNVTYIYIAMSYIQFGFTLTENQKQALVEAHKKKTEHTLRLNHSQLLGGDILNITVTQRNKITKAKAGGRNIELKLSKTQIAKNGDALGAIFAKRMPHLMKHAPKVLGTLGLAAASGGIEKAIAGSGTTKTGGFGPLAGDDAW